MKNKRFATVVRSFILIAIIVAITGIAIGVSAQAAEEEPPIVELQWEPIPEEELLEGDYEALARQVEAEYEYFESTPMEELNTSTIPELVEAQVVAEEVVPEVYVNELASKVQGIEPVVRTFNTSAYCACVQCCGKSDGITASEVKAQPWHTLAAGSSYPFGTIIYIPALSDKPNGGWFVVEDRGSAISNSHLDVFFNNHNEANTYGRQNLEAYIYYMP